MLCGLYSPTSGNADIHGYNLRFEIEDIRSIIGYCPQVDILFDSFNVKEHLQLIALVNGSFCLFSNQLLEIRFK